MLADLVGKVHARIAGKIERFFNRPLHVAPRPTAHPEGFVRLLKP